MSGDITLPPRPSGEFVSYCDSYSNGAWRGFDADDMESYARAAVLLDRQQRAADARWVKLVMEQAQVFASAWSLVGGPFDDGDALETAEEARDELRAMIAAAPPAPSAEPVNLNDPAVQKRLAAQWGYVSALSAEPVAWIESPHGAIRANPLYRLDPPPQSLAWRIPLYTTRPDHTALMRQALEALEERYIGALRDNAIDALRAALGEKRC